MHTRAVTHMDDVAIFVCLWLDSCVSMFFHSLDEVYVHSLDEVYVVQHKLKNGVKFFKRSTTAGFGGSGKHWAILMLQ